MDLRNESEINKCVEENMGREALELSWRFNKKD